MSSSHRDELLVLAYVAGQQLAHHEREAKINALIAAGHPLHQAQRLIDAWYAVHRPPRWYPGLWQLGAAGAVFLAGELGIAGDGLGVMLFLSLAVVALVRARYCAHANTHAAAAAAQGRQLLRAAGQL